VLLPYIKITLAYNQLCPFFLYLKPMDTNTPNIFVKNAVIKAYWDWKYTKPSLKRKSETVLPKAGVAPRKIQQIYCQ
jgi:hypothetical protein